MGSGYLLVTFIMLEFHPSLGVIVLFNIIYDMLPTLLCDLFLFSFLLWFWELSLYNLQEKYMSQTVICIIYYVINVKLCNSVCWIETELVIDL